jgi:ribonuclease P protein component
MTQQFKKFERLKSRKLIDHLFAQGHKHFAMPIKLVYTWVQKNELQVPPGKAFEPAVPVQAGVSVSTRLFKKAVDRNRVKRLLKEAWRLQKEDWIQYCKANEKTLAIFLIYQTKEIPTLQQLQQQLTNSYKKICK